MAKNATVALAAVSFVSGAAALTFEGLWFHLAGLAFGNSVWATSIVTASFMAGLALGGGWVVRRGGRLRNPLRFYALLETLIGGSGLAIVLLLPWMTPFLAPVFRPLAAHPGLLNLLRLGSTFALMSVPATAMGATLPVMVVAIMRGQVSFGSALGWLYGWNTLGGVTGVLVAEVVLIGAVGVRGTAVVAALLNGLAAGVCLLLSSRARAATALTPEAVPEARAGGSLAALLGSAWLAGAILLALEVVWFRYLLLFFVGTSLVFAEMLAVILAGIGLGGLAASLWLSARPTADRWIPVVALFAGSINIATYSRFAPVIGLAHPAWAGLLAAAQLMLPGALASGILFTFLGAAVRRSVNENARAAGLLTMANTVGALTGALAGGFVLLPQLGVEASLFTLAIAYVGVAGGSATSLSGRWAWRGVMVSAALLAVSAALFPFGLLRSQYLKPRVGANGHVAAFREGLTETAAYIRTDWGGVPHDYRLYTNAFSMSGTLVYAQHYMKLYVYWAMAMQPQAKHALLICYGVGNTAKALIDTPSLQSIDVVDISRDVLALGAVPYPPPAHPPLGDPRVRTHVEDGRFFLLTSPDRFDLITAEPPPPKHAGVVNLYSREYFHLIYDRLAEGGITTYWLPVDQLELRESQSIVRAFCDAFSDCSLWTGGGAQWMLAGSRHARPVSSEDFTRQWREPSVAVEMQRVGFDVPETLGAAFLADAEQLADWTRNATALEDNWPRRLDPRIELRPEMEAWRVYQPFANSARARFEASRWVQEFWPAEWRKRSLSFFAYQGIFDARAAGGLPGDDLATIQLLLERSPLKTLPCLLMSTDPVQIETARAVASDVRDPMVALTLGIDALARRDYTTARAHFGAAASANPAFARAVRLGELAEELASHPPARATVEQRGQHRSDASS